MTIKLSLAIMRQSVSQATLYGYEQTFWLEVGGCNSFICYPKSLSRQEVVELLIGNVHSSISCCNPHNLSQQTLANKISPKTMKHLNFLKINLKSALWEIVTSNDPFTVEQQYQLWESSKTVIPNLFDTKDRCSYGSLMPNDLR